MSVVAGRVLGASLNESRNVPLTTVGSSCRAIRSSSVALHRIVQLGPWEFEIVERPWGLFVGVPDCGGMADSLPRVPEQLAWAETAFAELPALERVWPTSWQLPPEALPDLEALFRRNGGRW